MKNKSLSVSKNVLFAQWREEVRYWIPVEKCMKPAGSCGFFVCACASVCACAVVQNSAAKAMMIRCLILFFMMYCSVSLSPYLS